MLFVRLLFPAGRTGRSAFGRGSRGPLLSLSPPQANTMDAPLLQRAASDSMLPRLSTLGMQNSILISGRMGRLQESDRFVPKEGWERDCVEGGWGVGQALARTCPLDTTHHV